MKSKYFLIGIVISIICNNVNAQDSLAKFKSYNISNSYFIDYLSFIKPNLAIVPCKGGIYSPNLQAWYLKTNDTILSAEPSYVDTSLIVTLTSRNLFEIDKVFPDASKKAKPLVITRGYIFYSVPSNYVKDQYFYVVGNKRGFNLCKLYNHKVDTLIRSDTLINQVQVINSSSILYNIASRILCYPSSEKPYTVFNAGKSSIYGFTIDTDGSLYISSDQGIIKITKDKKRSLITGSKVKGKLRFFQKSLYILDIENNKLDVVSNL